ncbi:MAG: D-glycerate dehydrogenase [Planctomycetia bacterium]|nr:D-glycerate dehydrogenase [Planctomycetia bacterium]
MALPRVFVTRRIPDAGLQLLQGQCDMDIWSEPLPPPYEILKQRSADCAGVLSLLTDRIDEEFFVACPRLKVVSNFAVGYNNIDVKAATARGIRIGNTPGVLTDATADIAFCLLIAAARRLVEGHQYSLSGEWKTWEPLGHIGLDLAGKTIGIVGMGRIGYAMAKRCHGGWGMNVLYTNLIPHEDADKQLNAKQVELDQLLAESDFVSVHVDLNPSTRHLFNAARFKQMKKTAVFINTARGPIHDEPALCEALKKGTIFAAGLDVTDPEPPDPANPILRLPNIIVAPHIASATVQTRNAMATIAAENLLAGISGKPLRHCVNP